MISTTARILCLGKFDGLHQGHYALLAAAAELGEPAMLRMTGMASVLGWPTRAPLLSEVDRPRVLREWGTRLGKEIALVRWPFAELRELNPAQFVSFLTQQLQVQGVVVGSDFRFAKDRQGRAADLQTLGPKQGLQVRVLPPVQLAGGTVSSSRIRGLLQEGVVAKAAVLYGRPHRLYGRVVRGDGRGRQLGVPTANLGEVSNLVPATGVYAGYAHLSDGRCHPAAINIGHLPTVGDDRPLSVEAHLLAWQGDCYHQPMALDFIERLRGEQRFANVAALYQQLKQDIAAVRAMIAPLQVAERP